MIARLLAVLASTAFGLGACATTQSCRALPLSPTATNTLAKNGGVVAPNQLNHASVAELQCGADQGIRGAQVALARRYEGGDGVPLNIKRAIALYEQASSAVPPTTAIYSPPVKVGGSGRMLFLNNPNAGPGAAEAQFRLGRLYLEGRGVELNADKGWDLIKRAADQGYPDAITLLATRP